MAQQIDANTLLNMISGLATGLQATQITLNTLATSVSRLAANVGSGSSSSDGSSKSTVQKPATYSGKSSPDARRFIAAFLLYAQETGNKLNSIVTMPTGEAKWQPDQQKWIRTALSFLTDEAAVWATPHIEAMVQDKEAFATWQDFVAAFRLRFETQDETADAKKALKELYQNKLSVPEYAARFREVMAWTGYSDGDLRDRFYEHLNSEIKDLLPTTERSTKSLDELITVATDFDTRLRQRRAEKARESGKSTGTTYSVPRSTPVSATPFAAPAKDPNAMDINATKGNGKTRQDFLKAMTGWCFSCGSKDHSKKDGNHKRDICDWCGGMGHKGNICQRKFMGLPKRAKAAATSSAPSTDDSVIEIFTPGAEALVASTSSTSEAKASVAATQQIADVMSSLLKQHHSSSARSSITPRFFHSRRSFLVPAIFWKGLSTFSDGGCSCSSLNVTVPSFQLMLGFTSRNHGMPSIISSLLRFVTKKSQTSSKLPTCNRNRAKYVILPALFLLPSMLYKTIGCFIGRVYT